MHTRINTALFIAILTINQELVKAEEGADPGVGQRITSSAKSIGTKIVEGVKKGAKKIEEKHVPEKIESKLKKAVTKTEEGLKKAEKKLRQN